MTYLPRPGTIPTLDVPDITSWCRVHLIGMGGAGMSGVARILLARGVVVSGSDLKASPALDGLRQAGAEVFVGHRPEQIPERPDAVVVSSAIPNSNPELRHARDTGVVVVTRAQVLAALMRGSTGVAVAGTHGKTTTTSMISVMLSRAGLDPTFVIGGELNESGSGAGHGDGDVFVAEADESDGSFLLLEPTVSVITNIEQDHLDFYSGQEELQAAFRAFAERAGTVVACWDDPGVRAAMEGFTGSLVRYGSAQGADGIRLDFAVEEVDVGPGGTTATVRAGGTAVHFSLAVPGRHNVLNATAALAVGVHAGISMDEAAAALGSFSGVRRRFERRGEGRGATFVDDYAHHPTEVVATLEAARIAGASKPRIVAVFQPHRYTRTEAMWRELGESLAGADVVVLTDVYAAGEQPIPGITGKLLVDALAEVAPGKRVVYLPRRSDVASFLAGEVRAGDLVLTLGAGDITMVGEETLRRITESDATRVAP